jgi:hypothetical protein
MLIYVEQFSGHYLLNDSVKYNGTTFCEEKHSLHVFTTCNKILELFVTIIMVSNK